MHSGKPLPGCNGESYDPERHKEHASVARDGEVDWVFEIQNNEEQVLLKEKYKNYAPLLCHLILHIATG